MPTDSDQPTHGDTSRPTLMTGRQRGNGRYTLTGPLGRGGMGVVWLAEDAVLREKVALKFLPPEIPSDPVALDDMRRETAKSRKLSHPNIIRIHDFIEDQDGAFVSMEFVDGPTLAALRVEQVNRVFAWEFLVPIVTQLCQALDYAHNERIIHRDLKPANMMLDNKGRLKLADFGIAAVVDEAAGRVSVRNVYSGTLGYMSPQQLDGHIPRIADDIYALGATLYELLTGKPPFYAGDIAHQVRTLPVKPIHERLGEFELDNEVPAAAAAMIMACLSKDPDQRPKSARVIAEWIGLETDGMRRSESESLLSSESSTPDISVVCRVCGRENLGHATFCNQCGQVLAPLSLSPFKRAMIYVIQFSSCTMLGVILGVVGGTILFYCLGGTGNPKTSSLVTYGIMGAFFLDIFGWFQARKKIRELERGHAMIHRTGLESEQPDSDHETKNAEPGRFLVRSLIAVVFVVCAVAVAWKLTIIAPPPPVPANRLTYNVYSNAIANPAWRHPAVSNQIPNLAATPSGSESSSSTLVKLLNERYRSDWRQNAYISRNVLYLEFTPGPAYAGYSLGRVALNPADLDADKVVASNGYVIFGALDGHEITNTYFGKQSGSGRLLVVKSRDVWANQGDEEKIADALIAYIRQSQKH